MNIRSRLVTVDHFPLSALYIQMTLCFQSRESVWTHTVWVKTIAMLFLAGGIVTSVTLPRAIRKVTVGNIRN